MIRDIFCMIEAELGSPLPGEVKQRAEIRWHQENGGERFYAPKAPKAMTMQRIIDLGTALPAIEVAKVVGVTPQHVRRIRRLLRS